MISGRVTTEWNITQRKEMQSILIYLSTPCREVCGENKTHIFLVQKPRNVIEQWNIIDNIRVYYFPPHTAVRVLI